MLDRSRLESFAVYFQVTTPAKLATFALALLLTGCAATPLTDPTTGIDQASGRIHVRADFIQDQADQIINARIGTPVETVKPVAETIKDQAGKIGIDQDEVDRLMVEERTKVQSTIDTLTKQRDEAKAWLPRIVGGFAGAIGVGLIVVGVYAAWTAKTTLNGTALIASGIASLTIGWATWHYGWLLGLVGVAFIVVLGTFQIITQIRKQRQQAVQVIKSVEVMKAGMEMTQPLKDTLNVVQDGTTKALVNSVTKRKAGK